MKLNDTEYLSNEKLKEIISKSAYKEIADLAQKVLDIRNADEDVVVFEQFTPTWYQTPRWTSPERISEGSLYDHLKRSTGLKSGDYRYRVTLYIGAHVYEHELKVSEEE